MTRTNSRVQLILAELRWCANIADEEAFGRDKLSSFLHGASEDEFEQLLREARRDNRARRALSSARYYSGLSREKCEKIDAVVSAPFGASKRK
jgi:hypothetical protein